MKPDHAPAYALIGTIYDRLKDYDKAKANYEKALRINPKLAAAANNLAWLYADKGENMDTALTLAQTAREQMPQDPNVADTLGWVYYKRNTYLKAISYLKEAAEKSPNNPIVQYHLGMAYHKNGDKEAAKKNLTTGDLKDKNKMKELMDSPEGKSILSGENAEKFKKMLSSPGAKKVQERILKKLDENHGNVTRTAEVLGLERSYLYRKMKTLGIAVKE